MRARIDTDPTGSPTARRELPPQAADIAAELTGLRREMLRFATLQLRDQASAEDAVQEAMLAALQGADRFGERARLKTWVFSILRNKIVDIIRRRVREPAYEDPLNEIDEADSRSTRPTSTRSSRAAATGSAIRGHRTGVTRSAASRTAASGRSSTPA